MFCVPHSGVSKEALAISPTVARHCRCHLCIKVRGGQVGGAAQAAWQLLRKNGIVPTREQGGSANGGGGISNGRTNAGSVGGAATVGTEDLKAVLELGARDAVRRLLNKVNGVETSVEYTLVDGASWDEFANLWRRSRCWK